MPSFSWPGQPDASLISDASLAALLAGAQLPPGHPPELRPLAEALAELAGRPAEDELDGEAETLMAFRHHFGATEPAQRAARNHAPRSRYRPVPLGAAAAAATILGLGGLATAAYAGALPAGLQRLAHDIVGAPAPGRQPAAGPSPPGPAATGQPGYGLCTAWAQAKAHGTGTQQAAAFEELASAAGGPGNVTAYCAAVRPGGPPSFRPSPAPAPSRRSGRPAAVPTPHDSGRPAAVPTPPTPHGSGKPAGLPTPHNSGAM